MSLNAQLYKSIRLIPHCLAGGFADIGSGQMLSMLTTGTEPKAVLNLLVGVTKDLFQGENVQLIESLFKDARGVTHDNHYFQEVVVMNDELTHVFIRSQINKNHFIIFICKNKSNVGLLLTKIYGEIAKLEAVSC